MFNFYNQILIIFVLVIIILSFYSNIDWFALFMVYKTLYIYIVINLLHDVIIYNSSGILVSLIYILCVRVLKAVVRILLLIITQNKNNSLFR